MSPEEGVTPDSEEAPVLSDPPVTEPKMWYTSAELWTALVALLAFVAQGMKLIEIPIPAEIQASLVTLVLFLLRGLRTKSPIAWTKAQFDRLAGVA